MMQGTAFWAERATVWLKVYQVAAAGVSAILATSDGLSKKKEAEQDDPTKQ